MPLIKPRPIAIKSQSEHTSRVRSMIREWTCGVGTAGLARRDDRHILERVGLLSKSVLAIDLVGDREEHAGRDEHHQQNREENGDEYSTNGSHPWPLQDTQLCTRYHQWDE